MSVFRSAVKQLVSSRPVSQLRHSGSWLHAAACGSRGDVAGLALTDQLIVSGTNFVTLLLLGRLAGQQELGLFALVMTVYYLMLAVQESLITVPYTIFRARLNGVRQLQYSGSCICQSAAWAACVGGILAVIALWMSLIHRDADLAQRGRCICALQRRCGCFGNSDDAIYSPTCK